MATYTGQAGKFSVSGNALAEVTAFSIDHTVNTIESTAMGDEYRTYATGMNEWSGSADILFDSSLISTFGSSLVGNSAGAGNIIAYPGGETAGYPSMSGNVILTGFSVSSEMEGMVSATISFQGNGPLTLAAVSS